MENTSILYILKLKYIIDVYIKINLNLGKK